jgi:uncharacterized protein YozE (UPF0346 family)
LYVYLKTIKILRIKKNVSNNSPMIPLAALLFQPLPFPPELAVFWTILSYYIEASASFEKPGVGRFAKV